MNILEGFINESSNDVLTVCFSFLHVVDLARAEQVCQAWKSTISHDTWHRAAKQINPWRFQSLICALKTNNLTPPAKFLAKVMIDTPTHPDPQLAESSSESLSDAPSKSTSSIQADKILLIFELEAFGKPVGIWSLQLSRWLENVECELDLVSESQTAPPGGCYLSQGVRDSNYGRSCIFLQIPDNPNNFVTLQDFERVQRDEACPVEAGSRHIIKNISASLSLWKVDTGQSHALFAERSFHSAASTGALPVEASIEFSVVPIYPGATLSESEDFERRIRTEAAQSQESYQAMLSNENLPYCIFPFSVDCIILNQGSDGKEINSCSEEFRELLRTSPIERERFEGLFLRHVGGLKWK